MLTRPMTLANQKEQFSKAYVRAVVSVAGYTIYEPVVDDDSVDIGIAARGGRGTTRSPKLDLQLKCTERDVLSDEECRFQLSIKNYNDLRGEGLQVPRVLVVLIVPDELDNWVSQSEEEMIVRRCAYWVSLREYKETANISSVTIPIPRDNIFSVDALKEIMDMIASGRRP